MKDDGTKLPRCIVIAGPRGAGKTTFAREFMLREAGVVHFVNADHRKWTFTSSPGTGRTASGTACADGTRAIGESTDFAFETTLSGRVYLGLLNRWKSAGYQIEIVFLSLASFILRSNVSRRACGKVGMMCGESMSSGDLTEVGTISDALSPYGPCLDSL